LPVLVAVVVVRLAHKELVAVAVQLTEIQALTQLLTQVLVVVVQAITLQRVVQVVQA
jgi:hypothetical protein